MSAPALAGAGTPTLRIRGAAYPVLLPKLRDPRLHLAAVIVSLHVIGQAAFGFRLSIVQILVSLGTCGVLEASITFWRRRVIMWPASALLTGNGVAFILRVPGTQHGDWWSTRGWWIYVATAGGSLLSKYVLRLGGSHVFNPSNLGLVVCFLVLGKDRADPLDFWWAPMSPWLALALTIIVSGGLAILLRLRLLAMAASFWLVFAAGLAILAATGHELVARWHLGPLSGFELWWVLVTSPEILIFLFFMITDPKTIPAGRNGRVAMAVGVAVLSLVLIAPQTTEFASKVALLGALTIVCGLRPLLARLLRGRAPLALPGGRRLAGLGLAGAAAFAGSLVLAGLPASGSGAVAVPVLQAGALPAVQVERSRGVSSQLDRRTGLTIARFLVHDLAVSADALRLRDPKHAARAVDGVWRDVLRARIGAAAGRAVDVPTYHLARLRVHLEPGVAQGPPTVVALVDGQVQLAAWLGLPPRLLQRTAPVPFAGVFDLQFQDGGYVLIRVPDAALRVRGQESAAGAVAGGAAEAPAPRPVRRTTPAGDFGGVRLVNVAPQLGLDFRQGSFRFGMSDDPRAMMGGGVCWLDYDNDGRLDLFAVNSYSENDVAAWNERGGLPASALYRNDGSRFTDVSRASHADVRVKGNGCVAADLNGDGFTDLYVTTSTDDVLLWNNGNGTFSEGARAAGVVSFGWHSGAAVADVNGDGRPDLFVAGYADVNQPIPASTAGFPTNTKAVRSLLFLNEGNDAHGRARFREVGRAAGIESTVVDHSLGAEFVDVNHDGRPDLYVANDEDPNRLYLDVPWPGGAASDPLHLGFRFVERGQAAGVADRNAGMGIAYGDYTGDGRPDLFVSNSRGQGDALLRALPVPGTTRFANDAGAVAAALGPNPTGWGASWADLDNDGNLDLLLASGEIPVTSLRGDARPLQVLQSLAGAGRPGTFANATAVVGLAAGPRVDGRGVAVADFNNDGRLDAAVGTVGGPLLLLENRGPVGHWLEVSLAGFHPGAVVTATLPSGRTLTAMVHAGSSYLSSEDPRVHFGLGRATSVRELVVRYPGGRVVRLHDVAGNRLVTVGSR